MEKTVDAAIAGGGAAGFFAAITAAQNNRKLRIAILEQGTEVLGKVRISGGGRCNVTHACFDVKELTTFYPRGSRELLGPFQAFHCRNTIDWFEEKGVELKTESDGRIFPVTDDSETIVDCLVRTAEDLGISIIRQAKVMQIEKDTHFILHGSCTVRAESLLIATGSNATIWQQLKSLGHTIIPPVPSLFTFNIKNEILQHLEGISVNACTAEILGTKHKANGAVLLTHWGLSGPAILRLSAFAAVELAAMNYRFTVNINWTDASTEQVKNSLIASRTEYAKKNAGNYCPFQLPFRLWDRLLKACAVDPAKKYADVSNAQIHTLAVMLTKCHFEVSGKSTNKDEFVTAGGVSLKEVDFKTMESKIVDRLHFAGETLNIDAVTGGFNFQAAWTTGYLAGKSIAMNHSE
jgi:predicted Rossmann fold flavoprotein